MGTRHLARLALTALVTGGSLLAAAGPAAAAPSPAAASLHVTHIKCIDQEDVFGADDPIIIRDGTQVWTQQMTAGDERDIVPIGISVGQNLQLNEGDYPDDDDTLGAHKVTGAGVYSYTDDGANYQLTVTLS